MKQASPLTPDPSRTASRAVPPAVDPHPFLPASSPPAPVEDDLWEWLDPEERFAVLSHARLRLPAKMGNEVVRLVRDVEREVFRAIGKRHREELLALDSYPEYRYLL